MRVLLVNDNLGEQGGAERSFSATAALLQGAGHAVELLGALGGESVSSWFGRWLSPRYYARTRQLISDFKPDLLHAHNITRIVSPSPILAARRAGVPVVLTLRDPHLFCAKSWGITKRGAPCPRFSLACLQRCRGDVRGAAALPYYSIKYCKIALQRAVVRRGCAHFICPSRALHDMLLANFPETEERSTLLPNFVERAAPPQTAEDFDACRFLFVGRITQVKGLHIALQAVATVAADPQYAGISLEVIGDGPDLPTMRGLARSLGISERVTFFGALPHADIGPHYARCCAVLAPSIWIENNPRVVLEAMNYGRPVIASNHGGFRDVIDNGRTGVLTVPDDAQALAAALRLLCGRGPQALQMGKAARAKLDREFSKEAHLQRLLEIYGSVLPQES